VLWRAAAATERPPNACAIERNRTVADGRCRAATLGRPSGLRGPACRATVFMQPLGVECR
jgi:hypothetical protein